MTNQPEAKERVTREELINTIKDISDGVIGAVAALTQLIEEFGYIESHIEALKKLDLRGSKFWVVWKDVCLQKPAMFIALLEDYLAGKFEWEDFDYDFKVLMERREPEMAKRLRETYVHPAMHRFLERALEVPA